MFPPIIDLGTSAVWLTPRPL